MSGAGYILNGRGLGVLAALTLELLGVPRAAVVEDYNASEEHREALQQRVSCRS